MSAAGLQRSSGMEGEPSSLAEWLRCMGSWLGRPLHCHALRLVWVPRAIEAARWADSLEEIDASTLESATGDEGEHGGWVLPLDRGESGVLCLFCASRADQTERASVTPDIVRQAAQTAEAAWSLARPVASEEAEIALVDRGSARQAIHDFRNGLNSLLMNAATLSYRSDTLPEPLRRFANQLQRDGERCSAALDELEQLIARPRPRQRAVTAPAAGRPRAP